MTLYPRILFGPKPTDSPTLNGITIPNYGAGARVEVPVEGAVTTAITRKMNTVAIPGDVTSYTITQQPAVGRAIPRGDLLLDIDLTDVKTLSPPAQISIGLSITRDGVTAPEVLNVPVRRGLHYGGTAPGRFFNFERDATGAAIIEPGETHRKVYVDLDGLSRAQISARHGGATVNGTFFRETLARNEAGEEQAFYYGETPEYALDENAAEVCAKGITQDNARASNWFIYKDDQTFANTIGGLDAHFGDRYLHPTLVTRSGDGENRPVFFDQCPFGPRDFFVLQDIEIQRDRARFSNKKFNHAFYDGLMFDGVKSDLELTPGGTDRWGYNLTYSRCLHVDGYKLASPDSGGTWALLADRSQNTHLQNYRDVLYMDCFKYLAGWDWGYDYFGSEALPQPPSQYSHSDYNDHGARNILSLRNAYMYPALLGGQWRGGGVALDCVFAGFNTALLFAGNRKNRTYLDDTTGTGNFSYAIDNLFVEPLAKRTDGAQMKRGLGIEVSGQDAGLRGNLFAGQADPGTPEEDAVAGVPSPLGYFGAPANQPAVAVQSGGSVIYDDSIVYNYAGDSDRNTDGLNAADLMQINLRDYGAEWLGGTPSARQVTEAMRDEAEPWARTEAFRRWCFEKAGRDFTPRTVAQTCIFRPLPDGSTPGTMYIVPYDWSTGDLPGTVQGDSIKLEGKYVVNSFEPPNKATLTNLSLDGGTYEQYGAKVTFTGDILTGGTVVTDGAGQIWVSDCTVAEQTGLVCRGGRFANTGSFSGPVSILAHKRGQLLLGVDASDWITPAGQTLDIHGAFLQVGFDGSTGATATWTLAEGATLRVEPTLTAAFALDAPKSVIFKAGERVTGAVSGATAVIADIWFTDNGAMGEVTLEDVDGTFVDGEALSGIGLDGEFDVYADSIGTIAMPGALGWPKIREVRSGSHGTSAPDVISTVVLAGELLLDLRSFQGPASAEIVSVDVLSGGFSQVTAEGLGSRDVTVTINTATGTVRVDVTTGGTGQVTQSVV